LFSNIKISHGNRRVIHPTAASAKLHAICVVFIEQKAISKSPTSF